MAQWNLSPQDLSLQETIAAAEDENEVCEGNGVSAKLHMLNMILNDMRIRMHQNIQDSTFAAYVGRRRSGKSVLAIAHAVSLNPDFTVDDICFSTDELKQLIYERTCVPVVWDEAGVSAYNRDYMTTANKMLVKFFQVFGHRRVAILSTFQHATYIDNQLRGQLDALFWMQSSMRIINGEPVTHKSAYPFTVSSSPFSVPYYKPYTFSDSGSVNRRKIGLVPVPGMDDLMSFYGVKNWRSLFDAYDKKKTEFFQSIDENENGENEKELALKEKILEMKEKHKNQIDAVKDDYTERITKMRTRFEEERDKLKAELKDSKLHKGHANHISFQNEKLIGYIRSMINDNRTNIRDISTTTGLPQRTVENWFYTKTMGQPENEADA